MSRNTRGGSSYKQTKKGSRTESDNSIPLAGDEPNCYYGLVTKNNGSSFDVTVNGETIKSLIRGSMRKIWLNKNDVVLVNHDKTISRLGSYVIIHKYNPEQAKILRSTG